MRALVYHGPRDVRYDTLPDPALEDDASVVVRVEACAICGSDLHIWHGHGFSPDTGFAVGHEAIGEIVETGRDVRRFKSGDRVLVAGGAGCGRCDACWGGRIDRCAAGPGRVFGLGHALQGGQAEAVMVPAADTTLLRIPDGITDEQALLLTDNLPTAWFAADRADVAPGKRVAVVGLGPVGLLAVESALVMGAAVVYAVDLVPERRAAAAKLGAVPVESDDPVGFVREHGHGRLADCVVEAVGADATVSLAIRLAETGATVSVVGVSHTMDFPYPLPLALVRGLTFRVGLCPVQSYWPTLVPLLRTGRRGATHVVSERVPLSEGTAAYQRFASREGGVLKTVLRP